MIPRYSGRLAARREAAPDRLRQSVLCGAVLFAAFVATGGCAGYRVGTASLYPPDIRTVYVPMFESNSFRRHLGERLTEAVVKEIELKTPYKVVGSPNADSALTGRILTDVKRIVVETMTDEPRLAEVNLTVEVTWVDRRGAILQEMLVPIPPVPIEIAESTKFAPEVGHSVATAHQEAIEQVAEQIVNLMEAPW